MAHAFVHHNHNIRPKFVPQKNVVTLSLYVLTAVALGRTYVHIIHGDQFCQWPLNFCQTRFNGME